MTTKFMNPNEKPAWVKCQSCGCIRPPDQLAERRLVEDSGLEAKQMACKDRDWCDRVRKERLSLEN